MGDRFRRLLRRAQAQTPAVSDRDRELGAIAAIASALTRAKDLETAARPLVEQVQSLLHVEFAAVTVVDPDTMQAVGVLARLGDADADWWRELRLDLRDEPSGIASAVFESAPVVIYDVSGSPHVSRLLAQRTGAKSGLWVPIVAEERVVGVLTAASTAGKRAFTNEEVSLLQVLAAEVALALERLRSSDALAAALGREQAVAAIARRLRAQRSADGLVDVATEELGRALSLEHIDVDLSGSKPRIGWRRAEPLSEGERFLVETVTSEIEGALETTRLLAENKQRIAEQNALLQAAKVVTSELELDAVLKRLVEEVTKLLHADAADLYLLDRERGILRCAAVHGFPESLVGFEFSADKGVAALAVQRERPVAVNAYSELGDEIPHDAYRGFAHALVAPMTWGGEVRGVLGVGARAEGTPTFEQSEIDLLETFAGLASLALRNAQSYAERTRQARVERAFARVATLLSQSVGRAETMDAAAHAASDAVGGDFAAVLMPEGGLLAVAGAHALPDAVRALEPPPILVDAAMDGRVLAAPRIDDDERFDSDWRAAPFSALLAIPVDGDARGLVAVFFREPRTFSGEDLELARQVAAATHAALERSRSFESERMARALSQQLARTGSNIATELDPAAVLEELGGQATALLGAHAGAVWVREGDDLVVSAVSGPELDDLVGERRPSTGWLGGDVLQLRGPVVRADCTGDAHAAGEAVLARGFRSYLGVPLARREGPTRGVLAVYGADPRTWRDEEIEALGALAGNASAALANAELYQRVTLEHEQSAAILSNVADGIVAVDRDGRVVVWNAAAERIAGVPATEAIGRTPFEVVQRELESETGGTNRLVAIMRGGEEVWLSLSEALMRDPSGAVAGRIFAFRDISAERVVDQMKSDFVSTVSHELRTPLTSIYGFAETLLRRDIGFSDEERETFLRYIASESERLTGIVDALLNVARLDSGTLEVDLVPTDLGELLNEAVSESAVPAITNGHRFVVDLGDGVPEVRADPDKLRQVVGQLVENAVKYSPAGAVVRVEARSGADAVEITVADEGGGIPETQVDRIFDKFYRGSDTQPGTGLGLFIAQGLVSAMGGRIQVRSGEGGGSRFSFALPVASSS
ncbi:MAG TPA: GAF domain-containing protein [Gaiellaceae bacterium]